MFTGNPDDAEPEWDVPRPGGATGINVSNSQEIIS